MNPTDLPSSRPTRVRYGVLGFACVLSIITYLDRVCFGSVASHIQSEFGLTNGELGYLFTAFALAYACFEVPSGWLGDVFGPRRTLIRIVLWWSCFTALTGLIWPFHLHLGGPWYLWPGRELRLAITGFGALLVVQFLFGAGEAGAYPNISRAFHNWFPFSERGSAQGAVWMAGRFGGGITPLVVLALVYDGHWRHIFWMLGSLGAVWCLFFWWWFRDRPEEHPSVNEGELRVIRGERTKIAAIHFEPPKPALGHSQVPWRKLLSNRNLWLLCAMYSCGSFGWYFNITWLPKYLKEEHRVSQANHGFWTVSLLTGAPLLLGSMACLIGGLLTDWFIRRTGNRKWGRRLFGVVGHGTCAICWFLSLTASSPEVFVLFVALAAFWNDLTMGAAWASCLDIGRKYSGIVSGCMNTIGNLGGALAGTVSGQVLEHFGPKRGWPINLCAFGTVYVVAALLWLRFDATKPVVEEEP